MELLRKNRGRPCSGWDTVSRVGQKDQSTTPVNREALRLIREGFAGSGMTQAQLADASEIPRSTLANILSPTAAPRVIHVVQLVKIAVALGVDLRAWASELEAFERRTNARSRPRKSAAPQVQKRAARSRPGKATTAQE